MIVYVLTGESYSPSDILGVFSTVEKAKAAAPTDYFATKAHWPGQPIGWSGDDEEWTVWLTDERFVSGNNHMGFDSYSIRSFVLDQATS